MLKRVPTRQEFEQMATRGRLHKEDNTVIPTDSELDEAQSPVDLGRLYGYTEVDIAHFYKFRPGLRNVASPAGPDRDRPCVVAGGHNRILSPARISDESE